MKIEIHTCVFIEEYEPLDYQNAAGQWVALGNFPSSPFSMQATCRKYKPEVCIIPKVHISSESPESCIDTVSDDTDILGFTLYETIELWGLSFLKEVRKKFPDKKIFILNNCPLDYIKDFPSECDYYLLGDPEQVILNFLEFLKTGELLPGIHLGTCEKTTLAIWKNLKTLPSYILNSDIWDLYDKDSLIVGLNQQKAITWETSRGCPYNCKYCTVNRGFNLTKKDINTLKKEIDTIYDKKIKFVSVTDLIFNYDNLEILDYILSKENCKDIWFHIQIMAETLNKEYLKRFQRLNCRLDIGLQSINQNVHDLVGRPFHKEIFEKKIRKLRENNISFYLDTIMGMEGADLKDTIDTFNYAFSLHPKYIGIRALMLRRGLNYSKELKNKGFISGTHRRLGTIEQVVQTPLISKEELLYAKKVWFTYKQLYMYGLNSNDDSFLENLYVIAKRMKRERGISPWFLFDIFSRFLDEEGYRQNIYKLEYEPKIDIKKEWCIFIDKLGKISNEDINHWM